MLGTLVTNQRIGLNIEPKKELKEKEKFWIQSP
jgi:hypothetical protein